MPAVPWVIAELIGALILAKVIFVVSRYFGQTLLEKIKVEYNFNDKSTIEDKKRMRKQVRKEILNKKLHPDQHHKEKINVNFFFINKKCIV